MPAINPALRPMIQDARLSQADVATLRQKVTSGEVPVADVAKLATIYADTLEAGVGTSLKKLLADFGNATIPQAPIANLSSQPGLLNGLTVLPDAGRNHDAVPIVQRALIALASRTGKSELMLPNYGADGDYGTETKNAIIAFQKMKGLPDNGGKVDLDTAKALDKALRETNVPPIFAGGVTPPPPTGGPSTATMTKAAKDLVEKRAQNFGVDDPWYNIDKNHALPAGVLIGGLKGKWKCNLFAGNTMAAAGFEPPYYGNRGKGEYPNANQLYKWSDKHAGQFGNSAHVKFQLRAEVMNMEGMTPEAKKAALIEALKKAEPGDMIIVDHMGTDVADGGHCRVVTANNWQNGDGTIDCAQASFDSAAIKQETLSSFTGEEHVWILRPNKPRADGAAPVT